MAGESVLDIRVHRKNMEVPPSLHEAVERKLSKLDAFVDDSGWVEVGFVEEQNPRIAEKFHCEIVAHLKGHRLKVEGSAPEALAALDRAAEKVDKQVRRLKDKRVKKRFGRRRSLSDLPSTNGAAGAPLVSPASSGPDGTGRGDRERLPTIADRVEVDGKPMTPVEAAMQLGVLGEEFLLFLNAETGLASVVYRRRGGGYGLVEMPA